MNDKAATKYAILIDRLYARTDAKTINWELDDARNPSTVLGSYIVKLNGGSSGGNPVEFMTLLTRFEEVIEMISDEDLSDLTPKVKSFDSYWVLMEELRGLAFRQAVGADKALDDIIEGLDDDL